MRRVLVLAVGAFALGLDAYVMAGLLPVISSDLHTTEAVVGQMVTAFTLAYALTAPLLASVLHRLRMRTVLVAALAVFTLANALTAVAGSLALLIVARILAGAGAGLYSAQASTAAAALVPPDRQGRALGAVMGGMSAGTVLGVPLGILLAETTGWRATMWLITVLGLAVLLAVARWLPDLAAGRAVAIRERLAMLVHRRVGGIMIVSFLAAVASLGLYTYLAPALHAVAGIDSVTGYLWVWGAGGVLGSLLVGPILDRRCATHATNGDRQLRHVVIVIMSVLVVALMLLVPLGHLARIAVLVPLLLWGTTGWALQVPQQQRLLEIGGESRGGIAVAANNSALYLGSATGSALGGLVLAAGVGATMLPWLAAAVAALGLLTVLLVAPAARDRIPLHANEPTAETTDQRVGCRH